MAPNIIVIFEKKIDFIQKMTLYALQNCIYTYSMQHIC